MALADYDDAVAAAEVVKAIAYANARRTRMLKVLSFLTVRTASA